MTTPRDTRRMRRIALSLGIAALALVIVAPAAGAAGAKTNRVSIKTGGGQVNGGSSDASISANGRYVAFGSAASNLVGDDTNSASDIFVHDRVTKKTKRVSIKSAGGQANGNSYDPSISATGRFVAFRSDASNLVGKDSNDRFDIFVRDRGTAKTRRVNVKNTGGQAIGGGTFHPFISANGRFVAFTSSASNLIGNDKSNSEDVFVHDRETNKTRLVSKRTGGAQGDGSSHESSVSANGRHAAFASDASTLVRNDTNNEPDVFVHDRWTKKTRRVSVRNGGGQGSGSSEDPALSGDGRFVAFESEAPLVTFDTNGAWEIYIRGQLR